MNTKPIKELKDLLYNADDWAFVRTTHRFNAYRLSDNLTLAFGPPTFQLQSLFGWLFFYQETVFLLCSGSPVIYAFIPDKHQHPYTMKHFENIFQQFYHWLLMETDCG